MSLKFCQIIIPAGNVSPPGEGVLDRLWREGTGRLQNLSLPVKLAGGAVVGGLVVAAAPFEAGIAAIGGAAAFGAAAVGAAKRAFGPEAGPSITYIVSNEDLERYEHYEGEKLKPLTYYAEHPYQVGKLISPSNIHNIFIHEQVTEIVSFLRSELLVTALNIEVKSTAGGEFGARTNIKGVDVGADATFQQGWSYSVKTKYRNPRIVQLDRPLVWMNKFRAIQASVKDATGGHGLFVEDLDLSFGVSAELAKIVGIGVEWLTKKTFSVEVEYGESELV